MKRPSKSAFVVEAQDSLHSSVTAVVVTYNRKELLAECLDGLLRQSRPVDRIVLIDNASTDGTAAFLADRGYLDLDVLDYVTLTTNTGGAGGFHEGVKRAYGQGAEWIWMMDDDVEPLPDALESMIAYSSHSDCIQGDKGYLDGRREQWERWGDLRRSGARTRLVLASDAKYASVRVGCFEGMLIRRRLIAKIGFPDKRFFIGGDDVAYGYLASKYTTLIFLPRVCLLKKIVKVPASRANLLNRIRTRINSHHSQRFYFLLVRNELLLYSYIHDGVSGPLFFLRVTAMLMRFSFISLILERNLQNFVALWRGAREGWELQSAQPIPY